MAFELKHYFKKLFYIPFFILLGCQLQEQAQNHGILFLENRSAKLSLNVTNKNDVIKLLGQPHAKNYNEDDIWIYIERTLSKGKYHRLGRHKLKTNNTLILNFDKYGVLTSKDFYDKNSINKIKFAEKKNRKQFVKTKFC